MSVIKYSVVFCLLSVQWLMAGSTLDGLDYQPSRVATVGDPVSVGSGEEQLQFPLYYLPGPMPVDLTLYYQSQLVSSSDLIGGFYLGIPQLWSGGTAFKVSALHGMDSIEFDKVDGGWQANDKSAWPYEAQSVGTNYFVMSPADETVYYFESINAGIALCRKKTDRAGRSLYYNYEKYGNRYIPGISSISNDFGMCIDIRMGNLSDDYWAVTSMCSRAEGAQPWVFEYANNGFSGQLYVLASMQNPAGETIRFNYWTNGQCITGVQLPRGNIPYKSGYESKTVIGFQTKKVVTAQTNALGGVTTLHYDFDTGRTVEIRPDGLTNVYGSAAYTTEYSRASGAPDFLTFAGGMSLQFGQDAQGNITNTVTSTGASMSQGFDAQSGRMNTMTVGTNTLMDISFMTVTQSFSGLNGDVADFEFRNETGRSYADGITEALEYDAAGNMTGMVDAVGQRWSYQYDAHGLLTNSMNPLGACTAYEYDAQGWLVSLRDGATGTNTLAHDAQGRIVGMTDALGCAVVLVRDAAGNVVATTNALGQVWRYSYDRNGSMLSKTAPDGTMVATFAYDAMDHLTHVTNALGHTRTTTYDVMENMTSVTGPNGITSHYAYDSAGHVTNATRAGRTWSGRYNADGLLLYEESTGKIGQTYTYDDAGRVVHVRDAENRVWRNQYDALGRLTHTIDPAGQTNAYTYDAAGRLLSTTIPGDHCARYTRDALGALTSITEPGGGEWFFNYSPDGLQTNLVDPLGNETSYQYTKRGQLKTVALPDGTQRSYTYDALGRRTNAVAGSDSKTHVYDEVGRLTHADSLSVDYNAGGAVTQCVSGATTYQLQWNDKEQLASVTYQPLGLTVTYTYDPTDGSIVRVEDSWSEGSVDFQNDAALRNTNMLRKSGITTARTWSDADYGRLHSLKDGTFTDVQYDYDVLGRVTSVEGTQPVDVGAEFATETDAIGFNVMNQVTNSGYSYSLRGDLTTAPDVVCRWDGFSRLIGLNNVTNRYDGLNRVIESTGTEQGGALHYSYCSTVDAQTPLVVSNDEKTTIQIVVPGAGLLYSVEVTAGATNVLYYHYDSRGSTVATTDEAGDVTGRYGYTPYGRIIAGQSGATPLFMFLGNKGCHTMEGADELYRHGARCYHPRTGQFISPEPEWPDLVSVDRLNVYNYSRSDPANSMDSNGRAHFSSIIKYNPPRNAWEAVNEANDVSEAYFDEINVYDPVENEWSDTDENKGSVAIGGDLRQYNKKENRWLVVTRGGNYYNKANQCGPNGNPWNDFGDKKAQLRREWQIAKNTQNYWAAEVLQRLDRSEVRSGVSEEEKTASDDRDIARWQAANRRANELKAKIKKLTIPAFTKAAAVSGR
ncbi:MAG: RHS repeat protein [Spartobacteria bacterium]|nr:RHS repeat protein [Spartobacteria bacterium]